MRKLALTYGCNIIYVLLVNANDPEVSAYRYRPVLVCTCTTSTSTVVD